MLLLRSAGLNIYAIPKVKNIDILFSQNRCCAGARTLYLVRFTFFCMLYVLCFLPYHSSIFPGHACFPVPCCLGLPLPVILLHSRKAFPAFPYGLSRVLKWAFPHGGKAFSVLLKMPSDAFSPAISWYSGGYVLCLKNCVYGGGRVAVRFWAILGDFAPHEYSFFHNHIAWICVFIMCLLFGFSSVGQPVLSVSPWLTCRVTCFVLWRICFIFHLHLQPAVCFADDLFPFSGLLLLNGCPLLFSSPVGAFIL